MQCIEILLSLVVLCISSPLTSESVQYSCITTTTVQCQQQEVLVSPYTTTLADTSQYLITPTSYLSVYQLVLLVSRYYQLGLSILLLVTARTATATTQQYAYTTTSTSVEGSTSASCYFITSRYILLDTTSPRLAISIHVLILSNTLLVTCYQIDVLVLVRASLHLVYTRPHYYITCIVYAL